MKVTSPSISSGQDVTVQVQVKNTGQMDGTEVVQVYLKFPISRYVHYRKWLGGFEKVHIPSGDTVIVDIKIPASVMSYYDANMNTVIDLGTYTLVSGSSSVDEAVTGTFTIK
mmetsp:Transcript_30922/g.34480  ORF Transcript_30922/g.34480 Transcript_30922/m.34480 type:complete len:112 (+) Transcript_30922:583-918(+)